jgi:hypothetical protein
MVRQVTTKYYPFRKPDVIIILKLTKLQNVQCPELYHAQQIDI